MWKKTTSADPSEDDGSVNLSLLQIVKKREVRQVWVIMLATNAIEYACGKKKAFKETFDIQSDFLFRKEIEMICSFV